MAKTTTIRLEETIDQDLKAATKNSELSMNTWIAQAVKEKLQRHDPIKPDAYKKLFVASVLKHLGENDQWASETLQDLDVYREGAQIFDDRFNHFSAEKELLAQRFIPWLLERILHKIEKEGFNVHLVVDSGTTLYFAFRALQRRLIELARRNPYISKLSILTNNIAGVNSYSAISTHEPFCPSGLNRKVGLADYVNCYVLSGRLLRNYAALTGPETVEALAHAKQVAKEAADEEGRKCLFISLLTGQWVRISEHAGFHPIPLARGSGQKIVKQAMIEKCEEVFLLSPLGKLFHLPELEIKEGLGSQEDVPVDQRFYEDVNLPILDGEALINKEHSIKLVTTFRPSEANVLHMHSVATQKLYRSRVVNEKELNNFVTADICKVPPLFYSYDTLAKRPSPEQLKIEFPHVKENTSAMSETERRANDSTRSFMMGAFSVPASKQGPNAAAKSDPNKTA